MGTCPLLLAAPCASSMAGNWSVQVQNDHRNGKTSVSWTRDVHIDVDNVRVSFLMGYGVQVGVVLFSSYRLLERLHTNGCNCCFYE